MKNGDEHLQVYLLDDPETGASGRRSIEAHLAGCADCRRSLESYRRARRLIAPPEVSPKISEVSTGDFVERVFSKVDAKQAPSRQAGKRRSVWAWPAAAFALVAAFAAALYFGSSRLETDQDLLAGVNEDFYEWATTSANPSDEDVLKVVLEDL